MRSSLQTDLAGRIALVTGAAGEIGCAIAEMLAAAGADVALNDLDEERLAAAAVRVAAIGWRVACMAADVSDETQVQAMFGRIDRELGPVTILVNNAGISYPEDIFATSLEHWNRILGVHLTGTFLCAREAMLRMRPLGWGRIVQVSSVTAHQGALKGFVHYAAAKAGQLGFTRTLARTAAPFGITVNAVAPGIVDTGMFRDSHGDPAASPVAASVPLGISEPADVAAAVLFLVSEAARHVTGATLDVNGGLYLR
jgi:3-oxoacyl-[acyl-carrier protein] reductase